MSGFELGPVTRMEKAEAEALTLRKALKVDEAIERDLREECAALALRVQELEDELAGDCG